MQNYLVPLQCPLKNKHGCQARGKATEETVSKYAVFCAKFLRCAIQTLKNVKSKGNDLIKVTDALKLGKMKHVNIFSCCLGVRSFLACENIRFSSLFVARDVRVEERLRLSSRNSILMTQINVYIINPVVMGFQIKICPILCVFWSILVKCCVHLPKSSSKTQILLLEKTIFHKY